MNKLAGNLSINHAAAESDVNDNDRPINGTANTL